MKTVKIFVVMAVLSVLMAMPVLAADGLALENGRVVYYVNGAKAANAWADTGATYVYLGADGYAIPNFVISKAVTGSVGPILTTAQMSSAVAGGPVVTTPVQTVTLPVVPVVPAVVPAAPALTDLQVANMEDRYFQRHYFNQYYEQHDDETHKAYCGCGEWAYTPHSWFEEERDGKRYEKCSGCGQKR